MTFGFSTFSAKDVEGTAWYLKISWLLFEIANAASILVTGLYFGLLFDGKWSFNQTIFNLNNI